MNSKHRPQKELVKPVSNANSAVNRTMNKTSRLKGGGNIEIKYDYLDEILHENAI